MSANGLMGMMRKPRRWRPSGTEPPALIGSREAPTTAIVVARSRTAWGDLGMLNSTLRGASVFETPQGNDHPDGARGLRLAGGVEPSNRRLGEGGDAEDRGPDDIGAETAEQAGQSELHRAAFDEQGAQRHGTDGAEDRAEDAEDDVADQELVGGHVARPVGELRLRRGLMRDRAGEQGGSVDRERPYAKAREAQDLIAHRASIVLWRPK